MNQTGVLDQAASATSVQDLPLDVLVRCLTLLERIECIYAAGLASRTFRRASLQALAGTSRLYLQPREAAMLPALRHCNRLQAVSICSWPEKVLEKVLCTLSGLTHQILFLKLEFCTLPLEALATFMASQGPGIEELTLVHCRQGAPGLTTTQLHCLIATHCKVLKHLNYAWFQSSTMRGGFQQPAEPQGLAGSLEDLQLTGCQFMGGLRPMLRGLSGLRRLSLAYVGINDADLAVIPKECPGLTTLEVSKQNFNLWECGQWSAAGVESLAGQMPHLQIKYIS